MVIDTNGYWLLILMVIGYRLLVIESWKVIGYRLLVIESWELKVESLEFRVVESW